MLFKWIRVPKTNETIEVRAIKVWSVRWLSRINEFSSGSRPTAEFFTEEDTAREFYNSLVAAQKLLRITENLQITVKEGLLP